MKSLTTLAAVATLIAGVSIAAAQNPASQNSGGTASPAKPNFGTTDTTGPAAQSGSQSSGSAMQKSGSSAAGNKIVAGNSRFCIETAAGSNNIECKFASMADCQKEAKPLNRQCQANPKMGATTGSGTGMRQ